MRVVNLASLEALAESKLSKNAFDYYSSGADDELALRANIEAFSRIAIHHRVLVDVSKRTSETTVLGHPISMPVIVAPTAFHKLACDDGELATRRAASAAGTIMTLSSLSNTEVELVRKASASPLFFQLYVYKDRGATEALVRRVEAAGCEALVLTVDAPLLGRRERDVVNGFTLPKGLVVKNLQAEGYGEVGVPNWDVPTAHHPALMSAEGGNKFESGLGTYFAGLIDSSLSWKDLDWLQSITKLPIVVKGIVRADDAQRAVDHGARAIVVSNHGGRQLDSSPATIEALPRVVDRVGGKLEILMDGGVRRGTDVLKALAYGARAVLVGRPILWGLALEGEAGALAVLEALRREIDLAMALAGCPDVASITRDLVEP